jgi:hypothetical protein
MHILRLVKDIHLLRKNIKFINAKKAAKNLTSAIRL